MPGQGGRAVSLQWTSCWTWQRTKAWWTFSTASESCDHSESTWSRRRLVCRNRNKPCVCQKVHCCGRMENEALLHDWTFPAEDGNFESCRKNSLATDYLWELVDRLIEKLHSEKSSQRLTLYISTTSGNIPPNVSLNEGKTVSLIFLISLKHEASLCPSAGRDAGAKTDTVSVSQYFLQPYTVWSIPIRPSILNISWIIDDSSTNTHKHTNSKSNTYTHTETHWFRILCMWVCVSVCAHLRINFLPCFTTKHTHTHINTYTTAEVFQIVSCWNFVPVKLLSLFRENAFILFTVSIAGVYRSRTKCI